MARAINKAFWYFSLALLCLVTSSALLRASATAQASNAVYGNKAASPAAKKKEVKFEVISIRPVKPGSSPYNGSFSHLSDTSPTPDGFMSTLTVWQMVMIAYANVAQPAWDSIPIVGAPKWFYNIPPDFYFINARVSDADMAAWRNQSNHHELLRTAMQDLLKERFKLVIHEQPTELQDYKLTIGKNGLKMKAAVLGSALPKEGHPLLTGGVRIADGPRERPTWHYYGATIGELVDFLGLCSHRRPVHDATGLTGRYDFTLQMIEDSSNEAGDQTYNWPVAPLGLALKPGKYPGFKLVIDQLEKPGAN